MTLGEVCLLTRDVVRLADFYRMLLECGGHSEDRFHQTVIADETTLTVCYDEAAAVACESQKITLAFTVDNVDAEYKRLRENGIAVKDTPCDRPWGARNMSLYDPDGNLIYLKQLK